MKVRSCTFLIKSQRSCAYHQCNSNQTCGHFERGVVASRNFLVFSSLSELPLFFHYRKFIFFLTFAFKIFFLKSLMAKHSFR